MTAALYYTIAVFMSGVIFALGRYSVRLEHVEKWDTDHQLQQTKDLDAIHAALRSIEKSVAMLAAHTTRRRSTPDDDQESR